MVGDSSALSAVAPAGLDASRKAEGDFPQRCYGLSIGTIDRKVLGAALDGEPGNESRMADCDATSGAADEMLGASSSSKSVNC